MALAASSRTISLFSIFRHFHTFTSTTAPPDRLMPKGGRRDGAIDCFAGCEMNDVIAPEPTCREGHVSPRKRQPGLTGTMTKIDTADVRPPQPALSTSRSELRPAPAMHLEDVISAVTKAVRASFDEARMLGTPADPRVDRPVVTAARPVVEAAGRRRTEPIGRSPYPYDVSQEAAGGPARPRPVPVASEGMHSGAVAVAALAISPTEVPGRDMGVPVQHTPVEEHVAPGAGSSTTQPHLDDAPLRRRVEVKTGASQRKIFAETESATVGSTCGGPAWHAEILDVDGRPLRGLTRVSNAPSADAGILDVDGRPLRGLARTSGAPAAQVKVTDLLDVDAQPLALRGRARVAAAPFLADADILDVDGRPLHGCARRAQNGDESAPDPISGPFCSASHDPPEHFSSRRKPIAHAPDTLSIYDDAAVPPQYYASDRATADFRAKSYVPMQARRKVEGGRRSRGLGRDGRMGTKVTR